MRRIIIVFKNTTSYRLGQECLRQLKKKTSTGVRKIANDQRQLPTYRVQ